jgi:ribonuclease-3
LLIARLGLPAGSIKPELALEALRHGSWLHEQKPPGNALASNERLEFLGDSVLGLLVSQRCCDRFPSFAEGELTRTRAALVKADSLAAVARGIGLGELLLLGRGEERSGGREKQNLLADALEAAVAAVYLSSGIEVAGAAVDHLFGALFEQARAGSIGRDYKTELQEMLQSVYRIAPGYQVIDAPGPQHARTFEVQVQFLGTVLGRGSGRTKKDAEQAAAKSALEKTSETSALAQAAAATAARGANAVHEADTIPDGPSGRALIEREGLKIPDPGDGEPGPD